MLNNIFEQLDDIYSKWRFLDKVGKEMQLGQMYQYLKEAFNYLVFKYQRIGYLTDNEINNANSLIQILTAIQNQKMIIDQELMNDMMTHLLKMTVKQSRI